MKPLDDQIFFLPFHENGSEAILAVGVETSWTKEVMTADDWTSARTWLESRKDWVFGWICYDVKNSIEKLEQKKISETRFPHIHFVVPHTVVVWRKEEPVILKGEWREEYLSYFQKEIKPESDPITLKARQSKSDYLVSVNALLDQIKNGDIYEVNYCQEFFAPLRIENPWNIWQKLRQLTEAPFSAYVRYGDQYLICASPERFLKRTGNRLISQPIKGTMRRGLTTEEDEEMKTLLFDSQKERSENVMIVDLVRNDLSKSATRGSVNVEELFGVHSFKTVHHLISTVAATVKKDVSFTQLICDTFPMGSMTGAPKVSAMKLIDKYEHSARGLYSGSVGYITPEGDFDWNVVIRSLQCNNALPYVSFHVGGAITSQSDPESEYNECMLKAAALFKALK